MNQLFFRLDYYRLECALKKRANAGVFGVEILGVAVAKLGHKLRNAVFGFLAKQKVKVVGHEAISQNSDVSG